jgi:hypothetical protein
MLFEDKPEDQAGIVLIGGFRAGAHRYNRGLHASQELFSVNVKPALDFLPD